MNHITEYIDSGILEMYAMGATTAEESKEVERMAAEHVEVRQEINRIQEEIEAFALAHAVSPKPAIKPLLLAIIDYMERLKHEEPAAVPPLLSETSRIEDYLSWLDRENQDIPSDFEDLYVKIIGSTPEATTAIVWLREMPYYEVHDKEYESFLIVEGTCDIIVEEEVFPLGPGGFFTVPLHARHTVRVTSKVPCKAILQRLAI
jgi:mannose-6-phosphate isomerase-like protein (cupin superfamily)